MGRCLRARKRPGGMNVPGPAWARWRAPLGYPTAALCLWLARPTFRSILIGSVLTALGLLIRAAAAGHLRKREALAHTGPYARTRNPLYFGSALIAGGFALAGRSWLAGALVALYFGVFYAQVMRREESELREQYGKAFDDYAARVPLFWPRLRVKTSANGTQFSFTQYMRNREYCAAIGAAITIVVLSALAAWRR
ncbi:MAG: isoprenylcysteine carboxylmethyltransferase family protein [Acidobacteria bacterium]|nr:MAG: isoprenylcysteine carboxylmethyltransferase family protein [Acidobacteriota bacterium]